MSLCILFSLLLVICISQPVFFYFRDSNQSKYFEIFSAKSHNYLTGLPRFSKGQNRTTITPTSYTKNNFKLPESFTTLTKSFTKLPEYFTKLPESFTTQYFNPIQSLQDVKFLFKSSQNETITSIATKYIVLLPKMAEIRLVW